MRVALAEGGYLGLTLLIGGLVVLLGRQWFAFTRTGTAAFLAVLAVVFGGLGLIIAGGPHRLPALAAGEDSSRRAVAGSMLAVAAGWTAGAVGVFAHAHSWFAGSLVGLVVAAAGYLALPTAAGMLAGTLLGASLVLSMVAEDGQLTPLTVGGALVGFGVLVGAFAVIGLIRQRELGVGVGAMTALVGAQQPLARSDTFDWACLLTFAVGAACLALYREFPVIILLPVGVAGISVAVVEAMWKHARGPAGLGITLVVAGVALISSSAVGLQMWRNRGERRRPRLF